MKPDITQHNPNPEYLRSLIKRVGLHQYEVAKIIGVSERMDALLPIPGSRRS